MKKWSVKLVLVLLFSGIAISTVVGTVFLMMQREYPVKYEAIISVNAKKYALDKELVFAVVCQESGFDKKAVSEKGAVGLMQIMPLTANWIAFELNIDLQEKSLFDPEINIEFGCFYLNYLFSKFEDEVAVLCAYNAGEGVVLGWLSEKGGLLIGDIPYFGTKEYVRKVLDSKRVYNSRLN